MILGRLLKFSLQQPAGRGGRGALAFGQAEDALADDVVLDLVGSGVNRWAARCERPERPPAVIDREWSTVRDLAVRELTVPSDVRIPGAVVFFGKGLARGWCDIKRQAPGCVYRGRTFSAYLQAGNTMAC